MNIEETLKERGDRYGSFAHHAEISQKLQDVLRAEAGWSRQAPDQKQALTTICDKIARMLNGDPNYRDNWHDIVGYAKLVDDRMAAEAKAAFIEGLPRASYETQPTDKDGFHNWSGNIMAPCSLDSIVTVRYTCGDQNTGSARSFNWLHVGEPLNHIVGWKYASAAPQPWNDHFGGPMAPFKPGSLVQVWFCDAKQPVTNAVKPEDLRWDHRNDGSDIIRWRYAS